ncbi:MAG: hypothetical protein MUO72_05695 [Bacteroidales bacterium]|nr:hypothetical protein [Bacteroidales bacterium]
MSVFSRLNKDFRLKSEIQDLIDISIEQSKREVQKESETTTKQQVLILYYLGVLKKIDLDTTKKSKLLSKLINRHEQNIRDCLTYMERMNDEYSEIKTKGNLEAVRSIFEQLGMTKEISLIDKDLKSIE